MLAAVIPYRSAVAETALVRAFRQPSAHRFTDQIRPCDDRPWRALPGSDCFEPGYAVVGDPDRKMLAASRSLRAHATSVWWTDCRQQPFRSAA
jgi:hypothetical protein